LKPKNIVSTCRPLELLHIDLFGPVTTESINGKKYGLVIVDDYSRWTWVKFLRIKNEAYDVFSAEAVNTACYVQNKIYIIHILNKTTYELFK